MKISACVLGIISLLVNFYHLQAYFMKSDKDELKEQSNTKPISTNLEEYTSSGKPKVVNSICNSCDRIDNAYMFLLGKGSTNIPIENQGYETEPKKMMNDEASRPDAKLEQKRYEKEFIQGELAQIMQMSINSTVDPCDDFYEFACGNWIKNNPLPKDKYSFDNIDIITKNMNNVIYTLLEQPVSDVEPLAFEKAKNYYKSCMNNESIESNGAQPLLTILDSLGGWPMINSDWNSSKFDWISLIGQISKYKKDILIAYDIKSALKNSSRQLLIIEQPQLGFKTITHFLSPLYKDYVDIYKNYMFEIATLLGAQEEEDNLIKAVEDVVQFEIDLAKISFRKVDRNLLENTIYEISLDNLENIFPEIDLKRFISIVFNLKNSTEGVEIGDVSYFKELGKLLKTTENGTIANYLLWSLIRQLVEYLDYKFIMAKYKFDNIIYKIQSLTPRWEYCVVETTKSLGFAVGGMFVQKYFDESSKNNTVMMVQDIKNAFREILSNISWLDEKTVLLNIEKINAMTLKIAYPDFILSKEKLDDHYNDVIIHPNSFFNNTIYTLMHQTQKVRAKVGLPVNKSLWKLDTPTVINAYFLKRANQIVLPTGILQPPLYHKYYPKSINYGGIGMVIGHEITHGFDSDGHNYDKQGNFKPWWTVNTTEAFYKQAQCMAKQYGQFTVNELNLTLNGQHTLAENIADNGGIKQAFAAYRNWLDKHGDSDEKLPGMDYTPGQFFFLSFAQMWCESTSYVKLRQIINEEYHSPNKFRVTGTLQNNEDFAREFNCSLGSVMNPIKKCSVW